MFEDSLDEVLKMEGGYVDHPDDKGGPTNYGITLKVFRTHMGKDVTKADLIDIPLDVVKNIYKFNYWDRLKLDHVEHEDLAHALFDQCVNRGVATVAKEIQRLVGVKVDGVVGPKTTKAINECDGRDLMYQFLKVAQRYYVRLAKKNPSQVVFLEGWLKRTQKLMDMVV